LFILCKRKHYNVSREAVFNSAAAVLKQRIKKAPPFRDGAILLKLRFDYNLFGLESPDEFDLELVHHRAARF
jgi:hypothetical protein